MTKLIELIYTDEKTEGAGTESDPVRKHPQLFTKEGKLVAGADLNGESGFYPMNLRRELEE